METVTELTASQSRGNALYTFLNQCPDRVEVLFDYSKKTQYQTDSGMTLFLDRTQSRAIVELIDLPEVLDKTGLVEKIIKQFGFKPIKEKTKRFTKKELALMPKDNQPWGMYEGFDSLF